MSSESSLWRCRRALGCTVVGSLVAVLACGDGDGVGWGASGGSLMAHAGGDSGGGAEGHAGSGSGGSGHSGGGGASGETPDDACLSAEAPSCAALEDSFSRPTQPGVELARADDYGDDVVFLALGGYAVLFQRRNATGPQRFGTFRIDERGELSAAFDFDPNLAGPDLEAKDVAADPWIFPSLAALACESGVCRIWGNGKDSSVLAPWEIPEVPAEVQAERLTLDIRGAVCAFGAQFACLSDEQTWVVAPPLPLNTGTRFQTVLVGDNYHPDSVERPTFALTDEGVVLILSRDRSQWTRHSVDNTEPIRAVSRLYESVVAVGRDGMWLPRLGEAPHVTCHTAGIEALVPLDTQSRAYALISQGGELFVRRHQRGGSYEWCKHSSSLPAPMVGLSVQTCGIDVTLLTLSPEQLLAPLFQPRCAID